MLRTVSLMLLLVTGVGLAQDKTAIGIASGTIGHTYDNSVQEIPSPSEPVPVIAFHGKKDPTIPYEGGGKYEVLLVAESIDRCLLVRQRQGARLIDRQVGHETQPEAPESLLY